MKWKNRLTNYNFWVSMVSALLLVLQACNIKFDVAHINEIITAVLGLLVVIGIINDPTKTSETKTPQKDETLVAVTPPKSNSSADNQKDEIDIANQNDREDSSKDIYPEIDSVDSSDAQNSKQVFVAETNLEEHSAAQPTIDLKQNEQESTELDNVAINVETSNDNCEIVSADDMACNLSNCGNLPDCNVKEVENKVPPQPENTSICFKIVN